MAFATEAHAICDGDGSCAVGRGAQHADGFLTRLEVVIGDAVHFQVVAALWLAQLRCEVGVLVARRRVGGLPRGGDLYGRTRHGVVGDAQVRVCRVGEQDDTRGVGVVGEKKVVAVELVGSCELGKKIGCLVWMGGLVVVGDGVRMVARGGRSADRRAFSAAFASTGRVERRRGVS
jgi:hypothetical protein